MGTHNSYETEIKKINFDLIDHNKIEQLQQNEIIKKGAQLLQQGEIVAFPTETVYGLGADAGSARAVQKIFKAKGRPQDNPLIVHIGDKKMLKYITREKIPGSARKLMDAFWPGPLTLIFSRNDIISTRTTAGLNTVAVRMPAHPVALALIKLSQLPVAAPSANSSGYPSPTRAEHVYDDLNTKIPLIIDGGACEVGVESTVIKLEKNKPVILRPGGITREQISRILNREVVNDNQVKKDQTPASPGMKYRHYSPATPLKIITGKITENKIRDISKQAKNIILVVTEETKNHLKQNKKGQLLPRLDIVTMGSLNDLKQIAHNIFSIIRELDKKEFDLIIVEAVPENGLGEAIMNRLYKAAVNT
ncbi:MAG: L-threonylcarbamoyladenylate synthase [Halanaerobiaceae bacterium]